MHRGVAYTKDLYPEGVIFDLVPGITPEFAFYVLNYIDRAVY
jgi:hypothetical protein